MSKNEEQIDLTDSDEQILNRVWQNMAIQDEASTVAQVLADPDNDHNRALALAELIVGLEDQEPLPAKRAKSLGYYIEKKKEDPFEEPNGKPSKRLKGVSKAIVIEKKGQQAGDTESLKEFLESLPEEFKDGLQVYINEGPPNIIIIDLMDWWGTDKPDQDIPMQEAIKRRASRWAGNEQNVVMHNEGGRPSESQGWQQLTKSNKGWYIVKSNKKTVAVDLDGTICEYDGWKGEENFGAIRSGAREALITLRKQGWQIIIFTTRGSSDTVSAFLDINSIPYDYVNHNPDQPEGSSGKVIADVYVDDRAINAKQPWPAIVQEVLSFKKSIHKVVTKTLVEKKEGPFSYSSTQVDLPELDSELHDWVRQAIPSDILAEDGYEDDYHVTIKYGTHTDDPGELERVVAGFGKVQLKIGEVSVFYAEDKEVQRGKDQYDVIKLTIDSPDLVRLNKLISNSVPNTDTFPVYAPHLTLAYVKPGQGKQYEGMASPVTGQMVQFDSITFSNHDGDKFALSLTKVNKVLKSLTWQQVLGQYDSTELWIDQSGFNPKPDVTVFLVGNKRFRNDTRRQTSLGELEREGFERDDWKDPNRKPKKG